MFHRGQSRVVAPVTVQSGEPEQFVAPDLAAEPKAPDRLVVWRRIRLRRKHRRGGIGAWPGLLHPLRKGILCPPIILAVEEKPLSVQPVGAALGLHVHTPAGGARAFGLHVAGRRFHLANRRFGHAQPVPS